MELYVKRGERTCIYVIHVKRVKVLLEHYGSELPAETVVGDDFLMPPVYPQSKEPFRDISQINQGRYQGGPNLSILANVCENLGTAYTLFPI